jgi:hypothetical protein
MKIRIEGPQLFITGETDAERESLKQVAAESAIATCSGMTMLCYGKGILIVGTEYAEPFMSEGEKE